MAFNVPYGYYFFNLEIELRPVPLIKLPNYGILKQVVASIHLLAIKIKLSLLPLTLTKVY